MSDSVGYDPAADVARATRQLLAEEITFAEFSEVFLRGRLWCRKGEDPGFLCVGSPGHGFVPIFTSDGALFRAEGACPWFTATGRDLLMLRPEGYGFIIDGGSDTEMTLVPVERAAA